MPPIYSNVDRKIALKINNTNGKIYLFTFNFFKILFMININTTPKPYIGVQNPKRMPLSTWTYTKFSIICPIIEKRKKMFK